MKNCINCTSPIENDSKYCPLCGAVQPQKTTYKTSFCPECGEKLNHSNAFCPNCGKKFNSNTSLDTSSDQIALIINKLSSRLGICSILWTLMGCIQLLIVILNIYYLFETNFKYTDSTFDIVIIAVIAIQNFYFALREHKNKTTILSNHTGIVSTYSFNSDVIVLYIWNSIITVVALSSNNILFMIFGLIALITIIFEFGFITLFVFNNKDSFSSIEKAQSQSNIPPINNNAKYNFSDDVTFKD